MSTYLAPHFYPQFECTGPTCEDTCCSGWRVDIDRRTFEKYRKVRHVELAPLMKQTLVKNPAAGASKGTGYASLTMKRDGDCHFLQPDKLCSVQRVLGSEALSDTCAIYPRHVNRFGAQQERSLGISCPTAARLVLMNPEPIRFETFSQDAGLTGRASFGFQFPEKNEGDPEQVAILNDFRALILALLQWRELELGARLMLLGSLMEDVDQIASSDTFRHAREVLPTLSAYAAMLGDPARVRQQFEQVPSDLSKKLELMTGLLGGALKLGARMRFQECLTDAADGLDATPEMDIFQRYRDSHERYVRPYFQAQGHILENYLVNQVFFRMFPFVRGTYLDLFREMVFNLAILQVLLVGLAARHQGLNDTLVLKLFQSYARKSDHNSSHLQTLRQALPADTQNSFIKLLWLVKEM